MERGIFVFIDLEGQPQIVGRLWSRFNKGRETASFEYEKTWLAHPSAFALEPALTLDKGTHHTPQGRAIFGAFGDSAPDRWGRVLMKRSERLTATQEKRDVKTLSEVDYLLMVNDETRQGALRFADNPEGPFLTTSGKMPIPPLLELLSTSIGMDDPAASLDIAREHVEYFSLDEKKADKIIKEVAEAVSSWRDEAKSLHIPNREIERMASAFEHEDSRKI